MNKQCPYCNKLLSQFYKDGFLGCPNCYQAFHNEIISSLDNYQGDSFHIGKKPKLDGENKKLLDEYKNLLKRKEQAGLDGRFKDMAEFTKEINALFNELRERGLL